MLARDSWHSECGTWFQCIVFGASSEANVFAESRIFTRQDISLKILESIIHSITISRRSNEVGHFNAYRVAVLPLLGQALQYGVEIIGLKDPVRSLLVTVRPF